MDFFINTILNSQNYFFSFYALFHIVVCLIMAGLTIVFIRRENFSTMSLSFVLIVIPVLMWLCGNAVMFSTNEKSVLMWWARIQNMGVIFLPTSMFLLTLAAVNKLDHYKIITIVSFILSSVFAFFAAFTDSFLTGFYHYSWGYYCRYFSVPSTMFLAFFVVMGILMISFFLLERQRVLSKKLKDRYLAILLLFLFGFLGGADFLVAFGVSKLPPIGAITTFISVCGAFVILNRYELTEVSAGFAAKEIIKTMNDILILFNKDGVVQFVNPAALDFFKISEGDFIGRHILQIIDDPKFSEEFYAIMKTGEVQDYEVYYEKGESYKKHLSLSFLPIRNGLRQILAVVCIAKDRTEDKIAESELDRAYAVPVKIIEGIPIGIIVADKNNKVRQINRAGFKLLDLSSEIEILNKTYNFRPTEDIKSKPSVEPSEEFQTKEGVIVKPDGNEVAVLKTSLPISINREDFVLDVLININERKALEDKLREYKEYLEKLVEERSKELKDANLQLSTEVSERKSIEEELKGYIEDLEKFKKITKDRNNKLIELKKEANDLALELGKPEKYKI